MSSKDRILQFLKKEGLSKRKFYLATGLSNGFLDKVENIGSEALEKIISVYPDLNLTWIVAGKGQMMLSRGANNASTPHDGGIDIGATAGENDKNVTPTLPENVTPTVTPTELIEALRGQILALKGQLSEKERIIQLLEEQKREQGKKISADHENLVSNVPVQPHKEKRGRIGKA